MKKKKVEQTTINNKEYRLVRDVEIWDCWWEDCWRKHPEKVNKQSNLRYWKKKKLYRFEYRKYRTWKHNRKTKWKE